MLLLKILGLIDLIAASTFLMLIFGINPLLPLVLFSAGLLLLKGLFIITGDVLSLIDLTGSVVLLITLLITIPSIISWALAFLLLAKGVVSFV